MLSSLHKHSIGAKRSSSSGVDEDKGMWYLVGVVAALLTTLGFVPQILKMRRTRSARDVSLVTLVQLAIGVVIWGVYGLHLKDPIIVAAAKTSPPVTHRHQPMKIRSPGPMTLEQLSYVPYYQKSAFSCSALPRRVILGHGVEYRQHLVHTSHQRHFFQFTFGYQAQV